MLGASEFFALFVIAAVILPIPALLDLARRDFPDRNTKAIWVLAVLLLLIIGPAVYFVVGRSLGVRNTPGDMGEAAAKGALASRASCARASAMHW